MNTRAWGWTSVEPNLALLGLVATGVFLSVLLDQPVGAAAVFMCLLVVAGISPRVGIVLMAGLAPFDAYIDSMVLYRDFLITDAVGLAVIVGHFARRPRLPSHPAVVTAMSALAVLAALHVVSLGPDNWRDALDNVARFSYFVALAAAITTAADGRVIRDCAIALVAAQGLRFGWEAIPFVTSPQFVVHFSFQFGSITSNPNSLAGFGACVLPLALSLLVVPDRNLKLFGLAVAVILMAGILLSYSKGSWLTALAGMAVWSWHSWRRGWRPHRTMVVGGLALSGLALLVPSLRAIPVSVIERVQSHGSALSNQERLRYVETAAQVIVDHPFTGVGLERFGEEYLAARRTVRGPDDPHNTYLMVAAELGIPALGCYLLFLGVVAISAFKHARTAREQAAPYSIALSASVGSLLVLQFFSAEPLASRVFWLLTSLALTPLVPESDSDR